MTLLFEGEDMLEIANKYWSAVPECIISDHQDELIVEGENTIEQDTKDFLGAYQYVTDGMDDDELEEYVNEHPEVKNSKLYRGEI